MTSRRELLAVAAVLDVALHARGRPVAAKALAARLGLAPRRLETLLRDLVRARLLKGTRGPQGGYELARERRRISIGDILRGIAGVERDTATAAPLVEAVVLPAIAAAREGFLRSLDQVSVEDLARGAEAMSTAASEADHGAFVI